MKPNSPSDWEHSTSTVAVADEGLLVEIADRLSKELSIDSQEIRRLIEAHLAEFAESKTRDEVLRAFYALLWNEPDLA